MGSLREGLFIAETQIDIETSCQQVPKTRGVDGGIICTGFIDVEKILKRVKVNCGVPETSHFFLEKKLPFQVVFIAFADDDDHHGSSGSDSCDSDSSGSDGDESDCGGHQPVAGDHGENG